MTSKFIKTQISCLLEKIKITALVLSFLPHHSKKQTCKNKYDSIRLILVKNLLGSITLILIQRSQKEEGRKISDDLKYYSLKCH